jgi:hypothetical protein
MGIEAALIGGGLGLIGSSMAGSAAKSAARTSANAQLKAAELAAEEARFRPVGITSRFGGSQFGFDEQGRLSSAGYELDPEIAALRERLLGTAPGALDRGLMAGEDLAAIRGAVPGLFGLAGQILPGQYDPTQAAQQYFESQQAMLDPIRQREEQRLGASVFGRGRAGLSVGDMGQPELFSLASARRQQDLALADLARERARSELQQDINIGTGLFGTGAELLGRIPAYETAALSPFQTQLGLATTIEQLGQQPLDIGAQLGGRTATAGATAGEALLRGGLGAAQTGMQGNVLSSSLQAKTLQDLLGNQQFMSGVSGLFNRPSTAPIYDSSYLAYGGGGGAQYPGYTYY